MRPRADEILDSVIATYEEYILPEVTEPYAHSLALTMANLMRHVKLRIDQEGPILYADIADLGETLTDVRTYLVSDPDRFATERADIDDVLSRPGLEPGEYPTLRRVDEQASELRWCLQRVLTALERARAELGADDGYQQARARIRRYLRCNIEREGTLIVPAFTSERR